MKDNYKQAESRMCNLERKLLQDPAKANSYRKAINKYVVDGVAEVPLEQIALSDGRSVFYLPHHAVIREDKQKTKTRVVIDASARDGNDISLSSCLEAGPALQLDLVGISLRFCKSQVGIMGAIEKMFLQICLKEKDRDSHRYLRRDLDTDSTPKIYQMARVTFGVICSLFLTICMTQEHARRHKETFPEASEEIWRNTHVDDFASGKDGVHEALRLQRSSTELVEQAAFNLTKWSSNSPELMQAIPEKDRALESLVNLESDLPVVYPITKALGLKWETSSDSFIVMNDMNSLKSSSDIVHQERDSILSR